MSRADFVKETSVTTGILSYSLDGAAIGFRSFLAGDGITTGDTVRYSVTDGVDFEVSEGVITSGSPDNLSRDTVIVSSNSNAPVNWTGKTLTIALILSAAEMDAFLSTTDIGVTVQPYDAATVLYADVTYELLDTNGDVGTGTGQLAIGNHNHAGVYEPADATIVKDNDIGVKVQGYDATIVKEADIGVTVQGYDATLETGATKTSRKNAIINGNFDIAQRGTSFAAISNGEYHLDMFLYIVQGTMVHTVSQDTDVPTVAQLGFVANSSLLVDCTTADTSIVAADQVSVRQRIEGYDWARLAQGEFTLSFWHKHTKTGAYCVSFKNSGSDRSYVAEYTQSVSDTWEKATVTVAASPSAGTWDYTAGRGLEVIWSLAAGTTFQTTAGTWQTGNFFTTSSQVNACDSVANNFRLAAVQLEKGSVATDFEYRSIGEKLALCQRYYEKSKQIDLTVAGGVGTHVVMAVGTSSASNTQAARVTVSFKVRKRATATITTENGATGAANEYREIGAGGAIATAIAAQSETGFNVYNTAAVIDARTYIFHWTADAGL